MLLLSLLLRYDAIITSHISRKDIKEEIPKIKKSAYLIISMFVNLLTDPEVM